MRYDPESANPDDLFADTRMTFGEHIETLRTHLIRAIAGFVVGMLLSFLFGHFVLHIITAPVEAQLNAFYDRRVEKVADGLRKGTTASEELNTPRPVSFRINVADWRRTLGVPAPAGAEEEEWADVTLQVKPLEITLVTERAQRLVGRRPLLSTMNVMEGFMVYFKVCALCGIVISSPWVFWQIWAFIAAGLYPHEKRSIHVYLPFSVVLFLAGVIMCQFLVIPKAVNALLWFNEWLGLEPDLRLNEWLSFALILPVVFGVSFQTPLVMLFLAKIRLLDADSFRRKRRMAWFAMAAFAGLITPVDALSMIMLWVPMCLLYELGILLVLYTAREPEFGDEVPEPDQMVGV